MIQRDEIRDKINEFCMETVFNSNRVYAGFGTAPLAVIVYLGDKTVNDLEAQMKGAFGSLLNINPVVRSIYVKYENIISASYFKDYLTEVLKNLNEEGLLVSGRMMKIQISFVAMMDDPIFTEEKVLDGVKNLKEQLDEIQSLSIIHIGDISFFGIFDQSVRKQDYDYSSGFRFIHEGSVNKYGLWKNVYHLQKHIYEKSFEPVARTVAMKILRDSIYQPRRMSEKATDPDDFRWSYIGMDEMKLPELLICNMLITAYGAQLANEPLNLYEKQRFKDSLEKALLGYIKNSCEILSKSDWIRYLPMNLQQNKRPVTRRFFHRYREEEYQFVDFSKMLIDKNMIDDILTECTENKTDELKKPDQLFNVMRDALRTLSRYDVVVPRFKIELMDTIRELTGNFEKRIEVITLEGSLESEDVYFEQLYERYSNKEVLEIAVQVLKACVNSDAFDEYMSENLKAMIADTEETKQVLEELRINSYGGVSSLKLPVLDHELQISIDTPVQEACTKIDQDVLDQLVKNEVILRNNTMAFMSKVQESSTVRNSIGQISGDKTKSPLEYEIFVAKDVEINDMQVKVNNIFRANTLQVLSYSEWSSVKNLYVYYREE